MEILKSEHVLDVKGVLFDTNRMRDEHSLWYMVANNCVAAFGGDKDCIEYLQPKDIVFFAHNWLGVVAAAIVNPGSIHAPDAETRYRDVEFITPVIKLNNVIKALSFKKVLEITGKTFNHEKTIALPYLSKAEAEHLVEELNKKLTDGEYKCI